MQACGLNPFIAGAGAPVIGTPVGRHQLGGEVVCLDPLAWLRAGLTTNPGLFLLGQPGAGKALDAATPRSRCRPAGPPSGTCGPATTSSTSTAAPCRSSPSRR